MELVSAKGEVSDIKISYILALFTHLEKISSSGKYCLSLEFLSLYLIKLQWIVR